MALTSTSAASTLARLARASVSSNRVCSSESITLATSASLPSKAPSAPWRPLRVAVNWRMLFRLPASADCSAVMRCRLSMLATSADCSLVRRSRLPTRRVTVDTSSGTPEVASPISTSRRAPSSSGSSSSMPVKARSRLPPTTPFSSVNTDDARSQRASLSGTETWIWALPSSPSSMRLTRPMGKPEKVMSMPTATPSEFSATSSNCWFSSNMPRAVMTKITKATISASVTSSNAAALLSGCLMFGR